MTSVLIQFNPSFEIMYHYVIDDGHSIVFEIRLLKKKSYIAISALIDTPFLEYKYPLFNFSVTA